MEGVQGLGGSELRILARANSEGVLEGRLVTHPYIGIGTMVGDGDTTQIILFSPGLCKSIYVRLKAF